MADELHWQNVNNLKNCEKQNRKPKTLIKNFSAIIKVAKVIGREN